jgi:hypothetical protein
MRTKIDPSHHPGHKLLTAKHPEYPSDHMKLRTLESFIFVSEGKEGRDDAPSLTSAGH